MPRTVAALALSTHPLPSMAVTTVTVVLGASAGLEPWRLIVLGFVILIGQFSVGLSNDWIDAARDRAVGRTDKPVASGALSAAVARNAAIIAAVIAAVATLGLGWQAALAHAGFIAAGWAYNAGLKSTPLSVLPYFAGFGVLPLIATLALPEPALASPWALLAGGLLGVAAHFANVLPDLEDDRATGVRGLPHRVGRRMTGLTVAIALAAASIAIVLGPGLATAWQLVGLAVSVVLATACGVLVLLGRAPRAAFRLIMLVALIDVVLLALVGRGLLA